MTNSSSDVPAGAYVEWEIELLGFDTVKDWNGLDFRSIMAEAENIRCTGNRLFKEGKYELTKAKYDKEHEQALIEAIARRSMLLIVLGSQLGMWYLS